MRSIFYGTSEFGLPSADWLYKHTDLLAVITTPDKLVGRKKILTPSPVKVWAQEKNIDIHQPENLSEPAFLKTLQNCSPEVAVVASYGKIMPKEVLEIPTRGSINIHPSLLPKYRGAVPLQAAILNGDEFTGVTLIKMDEKLDHGPIIAQEKFSIDPRETYQSLHDCLSEESAKILGQNLPTYTEGKINLREQDHEKATYFHKFSKKDGWLDFTITAEILDRKIRALNPWPGALSEFLITRDDKKQEKMVKILKAEPSFHEGEPGEVIVKENQLFIACGLGALGVLELQLEGSNPQSAESFLNGFSDAEIEIKKINV